MIILGGVLLVLSVIIPVLRLVDILPAWLWIDFVSYAMMVSGLFIGMMGIFSFAKASRDKHREERQFEQFLEDEDESKQ